MRTPSPVYRDRSSSGSREVRSSSSKVFETRRSSDYEPRGSDYEYEERSSRRYDKSPSYERGNSRVEYETVTVSPRRVVSPRREVRTVVRFNYVDVIRRYQTGDAAKDKMLTGK